VCKRDVVGGNEEHGLTGEEAGSCEAKLHAPVVINVIGGALTS
jgi:hypothetical protein